MTENEKLLKNIEKCEKELNAVSDYMNRYKKVETDLNEIVPEVEDEKVGRSIQEKKKNLLTALRDYISSGKDLEKEYGDIEECKSLVSDLKELISSPDIDMSEDTLSAFDLVHMMRLRFEDFRRVWDSKELINEVNKSIPGLVKMGKKGGSLPGECQATLIRSDEHTTDIGVQFFPNHWIHITKDLETGNVYYGQSNSSQASLLHKNFIRNHYDRLNYYFDTIEEFKKISGFTTIGGSKHQSVNLGFSTPVVDIHYSYSSYGLASMDVHVSSKRRTNVSGKFLWEVEEIIEMDEENRQAILKKIPLKVSELDPISKSVVKHYQGFQNKPQLVKKNKY